MAEVAFVDADLCTACAACIDECPVECIKMNADETCIIIGQDVCTGCAACEEVCPTGAIEMKEA